MRINNLAIVVGAASVFAGSMIAVAATQNSGGPSTAKEVAGPAGQTGELRASTYALFSGDADSDTSVRACAGVGVLRMTINIEANGTTYGLVSTDGPRRRIRLAWPEGSYLQRGELGTELVASDHGRVIRDGAILTNAGVCSPDENGYWAVTDLGTVQNP